VSIFVHVRAEMLVLYKEKFFPVSEMNETLALNKDSILNSLIDTLFNEIKRIREELKHASIKEKPRLRRELRGSSLALADLLQMLPEKSDMDEWLEIIQEKMPKKFVKHVYSLIKFTENVVKDEEVPKRRGSESP